MIGNIHVFNLTSQDLRLVLNGMEAPCGPIAAWSSGEAPYRPNSGAVPRSPSLQGGAFATVTNHLALNWPDGTFLAQVVVDSSLPLKQDLLLLIGRNQWQLVTPFGALVSSGPVNRAWDDQGG